MEKLRMISLVLSGALLVSSLTPVGSVSANRGQNAIVIVEEDIVVINEDGSQAILERVSENKIIVHEGEDEIIVTRDELGHIYVDGVLSAQVINENNASLGNKVQALQNLNWVYGGQRKYSMDFVDKSRATAAAMLALIPGWGLYAAAAATIANIWTSGKQLWFIEDTQVTSDGMWIRTKTRTYSDSNYKKLIKDSGWSGATRIHW